MKVTKRDMLTGALGAAACSGVTAGGSKRSATQSLLVDLDRMPDFTIDLWPDGPPGGEGVSLNETVVERQNRFNLRDRALHEVTRPRLEVFKPSNPDGSAILIAPGGGYRWVVMDKEGYEGARWFSRMGATVYVLMYRLPHQGWAGGPDTPLQDAQRATRVIRGRAAIDHIDPSKIMVLGFSAGGHVAGSLATRFDAAVYDPIDDNDAVSARPDLAALIYPVVAMDGRYAHGGSLQNLIGAAPSDQLIEKYSLESAPPADTPPVFLMHAGDDSSVPVENATRFFASLQAASVSAALHIFAAGGHGFGLRGIDDNPLRRWPDLLLDWAAGQRNT